MHVYRFLSWDLYFFILNPQCTIINNTRFVVRHRKSFYLQVETDRYALTTFTFSFCQFKSNKQLTVLCLNCSYLYKNLLFKLINFFLALILFSCLLLFMISCCCGFGVNCKQKKKNVIKVAIICAKLFNCFLELEQNCLFIYFFVKFLTKSKIYKYFTLNSWRISFKSITNVQLKTH